MGGIFAAPAQGADGADGGDFPEFAPNKKPRKTVMFTAKLVKMMFHWGGWGTNRRRLLGIELLFIFIYSFLLAVRSENRPIPPVRPRGL
jgi:hypothetical protein